MNITKDTTLRIQDKNISISIGGGGSNIDLNNYHQN